jgi:transposase InsO family protein
VPPLLSFLLIVAAGWVHRHQLIVIEFLQAENRLLKDRLRGKRIRFTDAERALLARKAKAVGRKALMELETIVSPDTLLRWHRRLIAEKWNFVHRRGPGRPGIMDFLTVEVWTTRGLVTHYLLFVISLADRVVDIVGITTRPDEAWMLQVGRNLIDSESGAMRGKGYLILDRDTKYTDQFRRLIRGSGTNVIRLPPRSPNLNAYAERFVRSIKFECLNRMIFIGQASLRRAIAEYVDHYHGERNHQGLDNGLIRAVPNSAQGVGRVRRKQRLGGMLNFYCREAV